MAPKPTRPWVCEDGGYWLRGTLGGTAGGGDWPLGALIELLVPQDGGGEFRLMQPALTAVSGRPVALLQPPHMPNALALSYLGLPTDRLLRLRAPKNADALWTGKQILRAGNCGALVFWQNHIRTDARRLLLAAQTSETLFLLLRPLASAADASPAVLRLGIRPAEGGLVVDILKRRGPVRKRNHLSHPSFERRFIVEGLPRTLV